MGRQTNFEVAWQPPEPQPIRYAVGTAQELTALHADLNRYDPERAVNDQFWARSGSIVGPNGDVMSYAVFVKVEDGEFCDTKSQFDTVTAYLSGGKANGGTAWRTLHNPKTDYSKVTLTAEPAKLLTFGEVAPSTDAEPAQKRKAMRTPLGRLATHREEVRRGLRAAAAVGIVTVGLFAALVNLDSRGTHS